MTSTASEKIYDSAAPRRPLVSDFQNLWEHRKLIRLLVTRDLTIRYKRSVLGVWWTLLNPMLTTALMWVIFSQVFKRADEGDVPFIIYLMSGVLFISVFFAQGLLATGSSLLESRAILSKIRVPGEVLAVTASLAVAVNFLFSLIPLLVLQLVLRVGIPWTFLLVPLPIIAMLLLVTGLGLAVAAGAVHFYDTLDFVRFLVQLAVWAVPTFYPLSMVPASFQILIKINPLYSYLTVFRGFIYGGTFAPPWQFAYMVSTALIFFVGGVWIFSKAWRKVVAYL
jgi:ABC-type polysaccharide/polyol phosphate export permease